MFSMKRHTNLIMMVFVLITLMSIITTGSGAIIRNAEPNNNDGSGGQSYSFSFVIKDDGTIEYRTGNNTSGNSWSWSLGGDGSSEEEREGGGGRNGWGIGGGGEWNLGRLGGGGRIGGFLGN